MADGETRLKSLETELFHQPLQANAGPQFSRQLEREAMREAHRSIIQIIAARHTPQGVLITALPWHPRTSPDVLIGLARQCLSACLVRSFGFFKNLLDGRIFADDVTASLVSRDAEIASMTYTGSRENRTLKNEKLMQLQSVPLPYKICKFGCLKSLETLRMMFQV